MATGVAVLTPCLVPEDDAVGCTTGGTPCRTTGAAMGTFLTIGASTTFASFRTGIATGSGRCRCWSAYTRGVVDFCTNFTSFADCEINMFCCLLLALAWQALQKPTIAAHKQIEPKTPPTTPPTIAPLDAFSLRKLVGNGVGKFVNVFGNGVGNRVGNRVGNGVALHPVIVITAIRLQRADGIEGAIIWVPGQKSVCAFLQVLS
mmetsp:Transcript_11131/g.27347  ORF Transcript_11131/g.27347 Transcript_11131/m.27347 type:complete len:204 (+) Transcript_11131:392-1003(+)